MMYEQINDILYLSMNKKKEVYYDGSCPMCTALVGKVSHSKKGAEFVMEDITKGSRPQHTTFEEVNKEIHVVDESGKVHKNADAMLEILHSYPQWRWLVWLGRLPVMRHILYIGYGIISRHRHSLFGKKFSKKISK